MSRFPKLAAALIIAAGAAGAEGYDLGRPALPEEIAAWDIDIRPDGQGLPDGSGSVTDGEPLYTDYCSSCHGVFGEAVGRWPVLSGGENTLESDDPVKTVGSYWPYLSTVYDYVHRAMPFGSAQSLTDDEVYAITAYLLYLNYVVEEDFVLSRETFAEVEMPNEGGFFMDDREETELAAFSAEPCMTDCKESVEITGRARVVDVTPDDAAAREAREAAAAASSEDSGVTEEDAVAAEGTDVAAVATGDVEEAHEDLDPEMVAAGEKVFRKCQACHMVGPDAQNRSGPQLNGLFGRAAGGVDGFRYSSAFEDAGAEGLVWTAETLAEFLTKPRDYIKGTKMSFAGLRKEDDVAAIVTYLKSFSE